MKQAVHTITIEIDVSCLTSVTDAYLAQCWHVAQANSAPHGDKVASELVAAIGDEIIKRWLQANPGERYNHHADSYAMATLRRHGSWIDGRWAPTGACCPVENDQIEITGAGIDQVDIPAFLRRHDSVFDSVFGAEDQP